MDYIKQNHLSILIIVFLVVPSLFGAQKYLAQNVYGALDRTTVSNPWTFAGAVTHSSTFTQTGASTFTADATFNGGVNGIVVTSTNAATSSLSVGCVNSYATSTATPIKLLLTLATQAGSTVATSTYAGITSNGGVVWAYGACL